MASIQLNRKDDPGTFVIEFEDGTRHVCDVLDVCAKLEPLGTNPNLPLRDALDGWKNALGLPNLSDFNTAQCIEAFRLHVEGLKANFPWLQTYFPNTGSTQTTQVSV